MLLYESNRQILYTNAGFICRACRQKLRLDQHTGLSANDLLRISPRHFSSQQPLRNPQITHNALTQGTLRRPDTLRLSRSFDKSSQRLTTLQQPSYSQNGTSSQQDDALSSETTRGRILEALASAQDSSRNRAMRSKGGLRRHAHRPDTHGHKRRRTGERKKDRPKGQRPSHHKADTHTARRHLPRVVRDWLFTRKAHQLQISKLQRLSPGRELPAATKDEFSFWIQNLRMVRNRRSQALWCDWSREGAWLYDKPVNVHLRPVWNELEIAKRKQVWPLIMLSTMLRRPNKVARVLAATLDPPPPGYAISDSLHFAVRNLARLPKTRAAWHFRLEAIWELLTLLLKELPPGHMPFYQRTFGVLARELPSAHALALYKMLQESRAMLHPNTALQFARKLAGNFNLVEHKAAAFSILKELAESGVNLNRPQPASVITALLHSKFTTEENQTQLESESFFSASQALQYFMEKGFLPNIITLTAFLATLCDRGEVGEAIRIAGLFGSNGLRLDERAYHLLLHKARDSLSVDNMRGVLELRKQFNRATPESLGDALHAVSYFAVMESRAEHLVPDSDMKPFLPMLSIYIEKFELEPLQSLIPDSLPLLMMQLQRRSSFDVGPEQPGSEKREYERSLVPIVNDYASSIDGRETRLKPSISILSTMLRAYVRSLWRPYDIVSLYTYFQSQLSSANKELTYAAKIVQEKGSLIHDTFILEMMKHPGHTRAAMEIFGSMLKNLVAPDERETSTSAGEEAVQYHIKPQPTVYTFGVVLSGLIKASEYNMAQQVVQVMLENGVRPSIPTWNMQIKMYARMQDVPRTVGALQELEAAGFKPNDFTFNAFAQLRDQQGAMRMMEGIIRHNKLRQELDQER